MQFKAETSCFVMRVHSFKKKMYCMLNEMIAAMHYAETECLAARSTTKQRWMKLHQTWKNVFKSAKAPFFPAFDEIIWHVFCNWSDHWSWHSQKKKTFNNRTVSALLFSSLAARTVSKTSETCFPLATTKNAIVWNCGIKIDLAFTVCSCHLNKLYWKIVFCHYEHVKG